MLMPIIGVLLGGLNFPNFKIKIGDSTVSYFKFIQSIIDFLIISLVIVRLFDRLRSMKRRVKRR